MRQSLSLIDGSPITLEQMLHTRDLRAQNQQHWLKQYKQPLISLTLVIPGTIKQSSGAAYLFKIALQAIEALCHAAQLPIIHQQDFSSLCGYEALLAIHSDAQELKALCVQLESNHPLGRLWDIDVICPHKGILSRKTNALSVRQCLVCQQDAHACARSSTHSVPELIHAIEEIINAAACS